VDGTLLTSKQTIHPRTKQALVRAIQSSKNNKKISHFFPATGKSRKGAFYSLGAEIAALLDKTPGVFLQGLYCLDSQGNIVFERKLEPSALDAAAALARKHGISIVSYDGDNLYTTEMTDVVVDLTKRYGEPRPTCLDQLSDHAPGMHKLLYLEEDVEHLNTNIRPLLEQVAAQHGATVTQAMPTMLELLPQGCSKALGVKKVCEALGIDPSTQLLAIGDAENDVEMLEMAAIGVAVGNASPLAKDASDFFLEETNDQGGAGVAMEVFGFGDGLQ
jgi:Cof subfamily protein (haloacid dehalogenase superfamily)